MCTGLEIAAIASAAATAGGNAIQTQNNNASVKAQYNARKAAQAAGQQVQQQHQQEATGDLNQTLNNFTPQNQQQTLGDLVANRQGEINSNITPTTGDSDPLNNIKNAPQVIKDSIAGRMQKALAFDKQQGDALGKLGATNDQAINNSLDIQTGQRKVGTVANFAQGDYGVNQAQQNEAYNNARKAPSMFGQLLSTAGTIGGIASSAGAASLAGKGAAAVNQGIEGGARALSSAPAGPIYLPWG